MSLKEHPEISQLLVQLESSMTEFIAHADYSERDVQACIRLMEEYLEQMEGAASKAAGMEVVERTVTSLNVLNERLDDELIETGQREDIAEIIVLGGYLKGYNNRNEDITEEWREW